MGTTTASRRAGRALAAAMSIALLVAAPTPTGALSEQESTIERLRAELGSELVTKTASRTGTPSMVRAKPGSVLVADDASASPESRALDFLADHGDAIGMTDAERAVLDRPTHERPTVAASELRPSRSITDATGKTHVRLDQYYRGLRVFGAQVVVHMNDDGITGVNGQLVPDVSMSTIPNLTAARAADVALGVLSEEDRHAIYTVDSTELAVYRVGLVEGTPGPSRLAYAVEVDGAEALQLWVDAQDGRLLNRIPLHEHRHAAKHRTAYSPDFDPDNPELFIADDEELPVHNPTPFVANLYRFTGQTFELFSQAFGFDSYDDRQASDGRHTAVMRTVALMNDRCPNAYWDGYATNYCPGFDIDDVVGHEWGHAYTDFTSDLIYQCQPGALNEAYSDIWGEVVDLLNDEDGIGGANNDEPWPAGQRWLIGEDLTDRVHRLLSLRDMWDPARMGHPDRIGSTKYACGPFDNEGVHTNSEIANHAFAMLTDGKTFNGVTVSGIGLAKASHVHFQAQSAYETPTTNYPEHAAALRAACDDLLGAEVADLNVGTSTTAPGGVVTSHDCAQVDAAVQAVEMENEPFLCRRVPLLKQDPPPLCEGATTVFSEDFEDGLAGWEVTSEGADQVELVDERPAHRWVPDPELPQGRAGTAAFAINARDGNCRRGPDISEHYTLDSPEIVLGAGVPELRFDHYVATRRESDGGNVKLSVNGGAFEVVGNEHYVYNGPNLTLADAVVDQSTNPLAGQIAWSGVDQLAAEGTWGTTVVDLSALAGEGDTIVLQFDFGVNCAGGVEGWYVDDVRVSTCGAATDPNA